MLRFIKLTRWKGLDSQRGRFCAPHPTTGAVFGENVTPSFLRVAISTSSLLPCIPQKLGTNGFFPWALKYPRCGWGHQARQAGLSDRQNSSHTGMEPPFSMAMERSHLQGHAGFCLFRFSILQVGLVHSHCPDFGKSWPERRKLCLYRAGVGGLTPFCSRENHKGRGRAPDGLRFLCSQHCSCHPLKK